MRILRSRLLRSSASARRQELSSTRRDQVKGGGRSEKIRTYNFKENRVTDHRIGLTVHTLDQVLAGQLDDDHRRADGRRARRQLGDDAGEHGSTTRGATLRRLRAERRLRGRGRRAARRRGALDGRGGVGLRRRRAGRSTSDEPRDRAGDAARSTTMLERRAAGEPLQYVLGRGRSSASTCSSTGGCWSRVPRPRSSRRWRSRRRRGSARGAARHDPWARRRHGVRGRRPRHRFGRARARAGARAARRRGVGDRRRATTRSRSRGPTSPASGRAAARVRLRAGLVVRRAARRAARRAPPGRVEPAVRRRATSSTSCRARSPTGSRAGALGERTDRARGDRGDRRRGAELARPRGGALVLELAPHQADRAASWPRGRVRRRRVHRDLAGRNRVLVARGITGEPAGLTAIASPA